jgi:hypothetical protein
MKKHEEAKGQDSAGMSDIRCQSTLLRVVYKARRLLAI